MITIILLVVLVCEIDRTDFTKIDHSGLNYSVYNIYIEATLNLIFRSIFVFLLYFVFNFIQFYNKRLNSKIIEMFCSLLTFFFVHTKIGYLYKLVNILFIFLTLLILFTNDNNTKFFT